MSLSSSSSSHSHISRNLYSLLCLSVQRTPTALTWDSSHRGPKWHSSSSHPASWLLSFSVVQQKKRHRESSKFLWHTQKRSESMDYQMGTLGLPSALEQVRMRCEMLWWRWHEKGDGWRRTGKYESRKITRKLSSLWHCPELDENINGVTTVIWWEGDEVWGGKEEKLGNIVLCLRNSFGGRDRCNKQPMDDDGGNFYLCVRNETRKNPKNIMFPSFSSWKL